MKTEETTLALLACVVMSSSVIVTDYIHDIRWTSAYGKSLPVRRQVSSEGSARQQAPEQLVGEKFSETKLRESCFVSDQVPSARKHARRVLSPSQADDGG